MKVCFRADASLEIGTGHVMRCLTLAEEIKRRGGEVQFVCRAHSGHLAASIERQGFQVSLLAKPEADAAIVNDVPHATWRGVTQERDAFETLAALNSNITDWLIVDHYGLDQTWERRLRPLCRHLFVVDDLADRKHDCDVLLDQTLGRQAKDYQGLVPAACKILAGPQFAPLRVEFAKARAASLARRRASRAVSNILVNLGGVDKDNVTPRVLAALDGCGLSSDCQVVVVLGATAPGLERVQRQVAGMRLPTALHVNVADMAALMAEADLAIGAAGTTSWERCCMGLPTLLLVLADNQRFLAQELERAGAALVLPGGKDFAAALRDRMGTVMSGENLHRMSKAAAIVTDGLGVNRIMDHVVAA
jgi:UDP-2,4-diacetamido-2,4,6-trideoxy-beta-L-altropyranose hydrolase